MDVTVFTAYHCTFTCCPTVMKRIFSRLTVALLDGKRVAASETTSTLLWFVLHYISHSPHSSCVQIIDGELL